MTFCFFKKHEIFLSNNGLSPFCCILLSDCHSLHPLSKGNPTFVVVFYFQIAVIYINGSDPWLNYVCCILFSNCYSLHLTRQITINLLVVFYFQIAIVYISSLPHGSKTLLYFTFKLLLLTSSAWFLRESSKLYLKFGLPPFTRKYSLRPSLYCCIKHFQIVKVENKINEELYHYSNCYHFEPRL